MNSADATLLAAQEDARALQEVFEAAARYFSVLGEPTRLRILHAICQEELCVNDIIKATGMAQANVSRHLGLMYHAGMLSRRREGTQVFYRVAEPVYLELCRSVAQQVTSRLSPEPFPLVEMKENASV
jgi:DNA-binding transcriptional ArsR family regulator